MLGGGGFVAGPMLLAARALRIPRVLTEADAHLGLANRLAAPIADQRLPGLRRCPGASRRTTRSSGARSPAPTSRRPGPRRAQSSDCPEDAFVLAVFGALAGARRINDACVGAYGARPRRRVVVARHRSARPRRVVEAVTAPPERYRVLETTDRFWTVLAAADLGVSRAGGTVWELAAAGLPALLVPYPHATGDHQRANAEHFAAAGGAVIVERRGARRRALRARVAELRDTPGRLADMRKRHAQLRAARCRRRRRARAPAPGAGAHVSADVHLLGIGGAGMSGIARVLRGHGRTVSGCDRSPAAVEALRAEGIDAYLGHDPAHLRAGMEVIVSTRRRRGRARARRGPPPGPARAPPLGGAGRHRRLGRRHLRGRRARQDEHDAR